MSHKNDQNAYLKLIQLAIPIILANVAVPLLGLVDTAVIGQTGDIADLAAIALAGLIFSFLYWGFSFLRMGTTGFVSQAAGAQDRDALDALILRTLLLAFGIGLLLICIQVPVFRIASFLLSASPEANARVADYFYIRIWGAPATLMTFALMGTLIGLGWTRQVLFAQLLLNGLNMVLNILFVVGLSLGVKGIALGTVIAEWFTVVVILARLFNALELSSLSTLQARCVALGALIFDPQQARALLSVNGDIMIRTLALLAGFAWFARQGAAFGDSTLAANHILLQFISMSTYLLDGFANVTEMQVGQAYGAKQRKRFVTAIRRNNHIAGLSALLLSLALLVWGKLFIAALTPDPTLQGLAHDHIHLAALYVLLSVVAFQFDGVFVGLTHSTALRNSAIIALVTMIAVGHLLPQQLGNVGLWWAMISFVLMRGVVLLAYYRHVLKQVW